MADEEQSRKTAFGAAGLETSVRLQQETELAALAWSVSVTRFYKLPLTRLVDS